MLRIDLWRRGALAAAALLTVALALAYARPGVAEDEPAPKKAAAKDDGPKDADRESIFQLIAPRPGEVIADVGCGKGTWTFPLARAVGKHGKVYAVDVNLAKTLEVKKRIADDGVKNVEVIRSLDDDPGLAADSVDAVFVNNVIHHVERWALSGFLHGLRKALKPSGRLIIRDPNGGPGRVIAECYRHGFTLIEARVPLEDMPRPAFSAGWYALKLQRADRTPPPLLPQGGRPSRRLVQLHLAEELFRAGVLTREELSTTWERITDAGGTFDPDVDERLDLIKAAAAVGVLGREQSAELEQRVRKK